MLAFCDHFGLADDDPKINPFGGAIALGHPLASSGVRLMIQLARTFRDHPEVRYGLTTMCVGLGMGGTVIWENPNWSATSESRADERRAAADQLITEAAAAERQTSWSPRP